MLAKRQKRWFQAQWWRPSTDRTALASLIVIALVFKIIILLQHPILARDGIKHLQFANDLLEKPWASTLREHPFHPGYALTLSVASNIFQLFDPGALTPSEWQWCAHLSSSLAGILLVLPLYGLARSFYSIRTAWLGSVLFLLLPSVIQITTDALTESWYLLFMLSALWALVQGVRTQRSNWFVITGLLSGAAYLVRVEAILIPAALALWTFWNALRQRQLLPSGCSLRNMGILVACFLLPPLPYMVTIGKFSNRPAVQTIVEHVPGSGFIMTEEKLLATQRLQNGVNGLHIETVRWYDAVWLVLSTHGRAGLFLLWPLAGVGFCLVWHTLRRDPAFLLLVCLSLLHLAMLCRLAATAGYTSERHTLLLLALAAYSAATGLIAGGQWLRRTLIGSPRLGRLINLAIVVVILGLSLPKAIQPLHRHQEGHRQAGLWLAEHVHYSDHIVDPYNWASFYAGMTFMPRRHLEDSHSTFGIIDPRDADLNRKQEWRHAGLLKNEAKTVWSWPPQGQPKIIIRHAIESVSGYTLGF